ncbi:MAG TPA: type II secretion system inner membrane protein GspF [Candidatus Hydrogenedentes bacterium]|nr:type II secretion system inner membrane protein GspF [Candidatus Hydrogenedentota bacterium]HRK34134.1 type II secretion system inner membrane protein GspF [Candidatus Hydrogenedentota bacterium]
MGVFEYEAMAKSGKSVRGMIDADTAAAARRKLREQELYPTKVAESYAKTSAGKQVSTEERGGLIGRVSQRDIALMTRQLAVLLQAGMPLVEALGALMEQTTNPRLRKTVFAVRDKVNEGVTLADALSAHKRIFSELYINMVRAGEQSGALESVLTRLADITERYVRLKNRVTSMLAYPILMGLVAVGIITFMMTFIVPRIVQVFSRQNRELPMITNIMIETSTFVRQWWFVIIAGCIGVFVLWRFWVSRPEGRLRWDRFKMKIPLYGPLYVKMISTRFARTLGTMLQSGLTMMTALDVVKSVLENKVIESCMDDVKAGVRRGRDLTVPLRETGFFPPMLLNMVELGQRSGEIENMLIKVADTYDEDIEVTVNGIVSLLEPIMILVMGVFVGFLVMSLLLPIFDISSGM